MNPIEPIYASKTYKEYIQYNAYNLSVTPASGNPKLLVIPVWFTDSNQFIDVTHKEAVRQRIETAYFGSEADTGWQSVKTFYEYESHGKLTITGTVSDWYEDSLGYASYGPEEEGLEKTMALVDKAVKWYFEQNPTDNRRNYDSDKNGYLDGVMLIYGAPNYSNMYNSYNMDNLWAYCYWLQSLGNNSRFNPGPNVFFWASYDFVDEDVRYVDTDAHTYIHEMGHVFGLEDYYDYNSNYSFAGKFSMQDQNVGGHDAYSSFALGWGKAYIPTESMIIDLKPFATTGEMIILSPSWNSANSAFDEYLILEYYTPEGMNEMDSDIAYRGYGPKGSDQVGIRLWHVDSRLDTYDGYDFVATDETDPSVARSVSLRYDNSYNNDATNGYHLLQLIRNDKKESYNARSEFKTSSMFRTNETFSMSTYKSQFKNSGKLNSGESLGYTFTVNSLSTESARITITKA